MRSKKISPCSGFKNILWRYLQYGWRKLIPVFLLCLTGSFLWFCLGGIEESLWQSSAKGFEEITGSWNACVSGSIIDEDPDFLDRLEKNHIQYAFAQSDFYTIAGTDKSIRLSSFSNLSFLPLQLIEGTLPSPGEALAGKQTASQYALEPGTLVSVYPEQEHSEDVNRTDEGETSSDSEGSFTDIKISGLVSSKAPSDNNQIFLYSPMIESGLLYLKFPSFSTMKSFLSSVDQTDYPVQLNDEYNASVFRTRSDYRMVFLLLHCLCGGFLLILWEYVWVSIRRQTSNSIQLLSSTGAGPAWVRLFNFAITLVTGIAGLLFGIAFSLLFLLVTVENQIGLLKNAVGLSLQFDLSWILKLVIQALLLFLGAGILQAVIHHFVKTRKRSRRRRFHSASTKRSLVSVQFIRTGWKMQSFLMVTLFSFCALSMTLLYVWIQSFSVQEDLGISFTGTLMQAQSADYQRLDEAASEFSLGTGSSSGSKENPQIDISVSLSGNLRYKGQMLNRIELLDQKQWGQLLEQLPDMDSHEEKAVLISQDQFESLLHENMEDSSSYSPVKASGTLVPNAFGSDLGPVDIEFIDLGSRDENPILAVEGSWMLDQVLSGQPAMLSFNLSSSEPGPFKEQMLEKMEDLKERFAWSTPLISDYGQIQSRQIQERTLIISCAVFMELSILAAVAADSFTMMKNWMVEQAKNIRLIQEFGMDPQNWKKQARRSVIKLCFFSAAVSFLFCGLLLLSFSVSPWPSALTVLVLTPVFLLTYCTSLSSDQPV